MPSTSPARSSRSMFSNAPPLLRPLTSISTAASASTALGGASGTSRPVMCRVSEAASKPLAGPSATISPFLSTHTFSQTSSTSASLWLTKTTATPSALSLLMMPSRAATSRSVSAVVGSSMTIRRAFEASARQIATSCLWATGRRSSGTFSGMSTPTRSRAPAASSRTRRRSTRRRPAPSSVAKAMFSATERFGNSEKSWKMTMTPAAAEALGSSRERNLPSMRISPSVGCSTPASILISVDFPEPFSPARQTASPGATVKSTPSSATTPP